MTYQFHDAIDRREAKERAMRAEAMFDAYDTARLLTKTPPVLCSCLEVMGDDDNCPHHGKAKQAEYEQAITDDWKQYDRTDYDAVAAYHEGECTCGPNDAPMCPSCKARHAHDPLPF